VRRGRVRLSALQVRQLRIGVLEAADADPGDRVVDRDVQAAAHERPAAAGRALAVAAVEDVVPHARDGERARGHDHRCDRGQREPAAAPGEDRGHDHADRERGVARLRVGEVEPSPDHDDRSRRPADEAPVACEQHHDQAGEDRDHQKASVDGRVPEDRVDAVEGRVRVRDEQLRVPEDVAVLVLVDPDHGEDGRHRGQFRQQAERDEAAPAETGERDREQAEREEEEEQLDRSLTDVTAPEEREAGPADEGRERPGDRAELSRPRVAFEQLPGN